MRKKTFPLWKNDRRATSLCNDENCEGIRELLDAIGKKELRLVENHCLCHNEHAEDDIVVSEKDRYGLPIPQILCSKCGLIRCGLVFDEASNNMFYEKYYRKIYTTNSPTDTFFQNQIKYGREIWNLFEQNNLTEEITNVVEIGCGAGGILIPFQEKGKDVSGYDFDNNYLSYGKDKGLNILYGNFCSQAKDNSFDLIILNHVFEHFLQPLQELQKILPKLKTGRYLYIQVPGIYCISEIYPDPLTYFQNAHVYYFYEQYLRILFENFKLKVVYGDERCTFICKKISDIIPNVDCIYDKCLSDYPRKNAEYLGDCKNRYDELKRTTFKTKLYNIACAMGWKLIRPYIKRNKTYSR